MIRPRITYAAVFACTIDGRITDHEGHFSRWGSMEDHVFFQELMQSHDAAVVGRVTYEHLAEVPVFPKPLYVFTQHLEQFISTERVMYLDPLCTDIEKVLEHAAYQRVLIIGGTRTYSYFLQRQMLHELFVTIEPMVFGQGKNAFSYKPFSIFPLILVDMKKINDRGTVLLHYRVLSSKELSETMYCV